MIHALRIAVCCSSLLLLQGCVTGSMLRTARVLDKNQFELSGGIAKNELGDVTQVVIAAYGISDYVEIEGRWEDEYFSLTPRIQLLTAKKQWVDCLVFGEAGYGNEMGFLGGTGIMFGRRFDDFSPYIAYRYRKWKHADVFDLVERRAHYLKMGGRYYLPPFWKKSHTQQPAWFIGAEVGPTFFPNEGAVVEFALNIGWNL